MTRQELEHAIRAACDVARDHEVIVLGSQAILGAFPNAPDTLRYSREVDVYPKNHPERSEAIDGVLGEESLFQQTHGFYVHGVGPETAVLPTGWQWRLVPVRGPGTRGNVGWCLEPHDIAASKLVPWREKDRDYVAALVAHGMVDVDELVRRAEALELSDAFPASYRALVVERAHGLARPVTSSPPPRAIPRVPARSTPPPDVTRADPGTGAHAASGLRA